ncbi:hypothetical protein U9M48_006844 [Paspalum notatum var. saurae]|uniref:Uncharacterized protein n=1 Tax=Paspalum notatum var. saurae TaxID=547442 RepID=A0AAQ3PYT4_PASNO
MRVAAPANPSSPPRATERREEDDGGGVIFESTPRVLNPANEELPPDRPLIEKPEDDSEDPHATANPLAEEAPPNPSGEGIEFFMCPCVGGGTCVQHD